MEIGCACVSPHDPNLDLQADLRTDGCSHMFQDIALGAIPTVSQSNGYSALPDFVIR